MHINESAEDYLESILMLQQQKGTVRSIDIVRHMNYSKPSVSRAVHLLCDQGHILMDRDGMITLTDSGRAIAESMLERHRLLTHWLIKLGVSPAVAAEDACRLEHDLSEETFRCMKNHIISSKEP